MTAALCACLVLAGCGGAGHAARSRSPNGIYHQVKPGQTLWSIARAYEVDLERLARSNRLSNRNELRVGQRLLIPGARRQRQVASRCPCPDTSPPTTQKDLPHTASKQPAVSQHPTAPITLSWPIHGTITRHFHQNGRQRHDGIDIAAPRGSLIRAAADGKVIFSDWGPGGYGRLVIVQHTLNIVTVYAHNERNLVQRNQRVKQGQAIATVGRSGRATDYHLHFEVRHNTVPKPPHIFFSPPQHQVGIQDIHRVPSTHPKSTDVYWIKGIT